MLTTPAALPRRNEEAYSIDVPTLITAAERLASTR
jgi:hypothetical protein